MSSGATKPACISPSVGEIATQALGRMPAGAVEEHRAGCIACELERLAFASLDEYAVEPSPGLRAWAQTIVREKGTPRL